MSVAVFTALNAVLATGVVAGLAAAMRMPLVAGPREQVEQVDRPVELRPGAQPESEPVAV